MELALPVERGGKDGLHRPSHRATTDLKIILTKLIFPSTKRKKKKKEKRGREIDKEGGKQGHYRNANYDIIKKGFFCIFCFSRFVCVINISGGGSFLHLANCTMISFQYLQDSTLEKSKYWWKK